MNPKSSQIDRKIAAAWEAEKSDIRPPTDNAQCHVKAHETEAGRSSLGSTLSITEPLSSANCEKGGQPGVKKVRER